MTTRTMLYGIMTAALLCTAPAYAKPHDKSHGKGSEHAKHEEHGKGKDDSVLEIAISIADRSLIKGYLNDNYRPKNCPPGLAKKNNGCLPPGIAKKYSMGKPLPPGIAKKHLPDSLLSQLTPIAGYQYVQVDKDVLLISEATHKVIDAVTLLSAVK